jgi:acyl-CoA synthetase (AMP-forming)/AMP-acid ligase II
VTQGTAGPSRTGTKERAQTRGRVLEGVPETVSELLVARARLQPTRRAYTFLDAQGREAQSLSYDELDAVARSVAATLRERGAAGQPVLLLCSPGLEFIGAYFGCLYAGAIAVPADAGRPNRPSARLRSILLDSGARHLLTDLSQRSAREANMDLEGVECISLDALGEPPPGAWREPDPEGGDLAMLQYTSGSTGVPKGVMVSHDNLVQNLEAIRQQLRATADDRTVSWLPHYHDLGLVGGILQPLYTGSLSILLSHQTFIQRPIIWLQAIERYRGTITPGPNFAFEHCVRRIPEERRRGLDLTSLRVAVSGSEMVNADTINRFSRAFRNCGFRPEAFSPCYGMAEATLLVAGGQAETLPVVHKLPNSSRRSVACGRAIPGHEIVIVDPASGRRCKEGEEGEIWFSGPSVAGGYWGRPDETTQVFRARLSDKPDIPFLRTGDLGCLIDGELHITGRIKDIIIIAGVNHHPEDIEHFAAESHPWVRPGSCVAFGVDKGGEESIALAFELQRHQWHQLRKQKQGPRLAASPDADVVTLETIRGAVRQALSRELGVGVQTLIPVPPFSLPRTSSGKIKHGQSRANFLAGRWPSLQSPLRGQQPRTPEPGLSF